MLWTRTRYLKLTYFQQLWQFCCFSLDSLRSNAFDSQLNYRPELNYKVSEYPFKQNETVMRCFRALLLPYFQYFQYFCIFSNNFNKYFVPFSCSPNIGKMRVKIGQKTNQFFYFTSSCTNRFVVFYSFFSLKCISPRPKQNR